MEEQLKISDFVKPEIDYLLEQCNFTKEQLDFFKLRADDIPIEKCAEIMNISISTANRISKKVNKKIEKVI